MAQDVITQSYVDVGGAQRNEMTGWVLNPGGAVHESMPSDVSIVQHSGGIPQWNFGVTYVDTSFALFQIMQPYHLTSQNYEVRPDDAIASGSNPKISGAALVELGSHSFNNGGQFEGAATLHANTFTLATS